MTDFVETSLEALIEKAFRAMITDVELGLPAVVVSYDASTQRARVQPLARKHYRDGTVEKIPAIDAVPVQFPRGAGFAITWPLNPGDPVWLAFSGRPFDAWKSTGSAESAEPTRRRFALSDCVAFPQGPGSKSAPLQSATDDALVIGEDQGAQIRIRDGKIAVGTPTAELLDLLDQLIGALQTTMTATVMGPQPFDPATQATLTSIKALLAQIKE